MRRREEWRLAGSLLFLLLATCAQCQTDGKRTSIPSRGLFSPLAGRSHTSVATAACRLPACQPFLTLPLPPRCTCRDVSTARVPGRGAPGDARVGPRLRPGEGAQGDGAGGGARQPGAGGRGQCPRHALRPGECGIRSGGWKRRTLRGGARGRGCRAPLVQERLQTCRRVQTRIPTSCRAAAQVMYGDSITSKAGYGPGARVWDEYFGNLTAAPLGILGEKGPWGGEAASASCCDSCLLVSSPPACIPASSAPLPCLPR